MSWRGIVEPQSLQRHVVEVSWFQLFVMTLLIAVFFVCANEIVDRQSHDHHCVWH